MNVYKLRNTNGQVFAFEVENAYIRPQKIALLLGMVGEVSDIRTRKIFSSPADVHVSFKYRGQDFIVWEPYGDSSRYWIGPKREGEPLDVSQLEKIFENHKPSIAMKILGNLITLNLKSFQKTSD